VASDNVLILRVSRNTNDPVDVLSFPLPSPSLGKRDSYIKVSDLAGRPAILPGAPNICRACIYDLSVRPPDMPVKAIPSP